MKLRRNIGTTIASCGVAMLLFGMGTLPVHGAERPTVAMQPSPRPAIDPVGQGGGGAGVPMGHVTGTVIDQRTGAPVAGVAVKIGDEVVTTDANGNYDHWVPVGSYPVELSLAGDQGVPAQGAVMVDVQPDVATVQHLNFASPAPVAPTAAPTVAPAVPTAEPAPAAAAQPVVAARQPAIKAPKPAVESPPNRLPRTAGDSAVPWLWMACGMLLLMAGGVVGFAPMINGRSAAALLRAQAANSALLQSLLAQPPVDEFLAALFASHERRRK